MPDGLPDLPGLAQGVKVLKALDSVGIIPTGWVWRWRPGFKGGVFPPHEALDYQHERDISNFDTLPRGDVNGEHCQCDLQTLWRDKRSGRFAPPPRR